VEALAKSNDKLTEELTNFIRN